MRLIKLINSSVIYPTQFWIFPPHLHPIVIQKDDQCLPFSRPSSLISITKMALRTHFILEWLMVTGNVLLEDSIINLIIAHDQWHNTITKYYNYMKHLRRLCFNQFAFSLVEIGSWLMMSGYLICSRCQNKQKTGFLSNNVPICLTVISVYDGKTVQKIPQNPFNPPKTKSLHVLPCSCGGCTFLPTH